MRYLLFIIFLAFCSCLGVVDEKVLVPYTKPPFIKELVGTYEADSFTYQLIKKKKIYEEKKMSLRLLENNTFKGENFPDFLNLLKRDSIKGELLNVSGTWEISKIEDRWLIFLNFEDASYTYNIYLKESKPALLFFIGDPDNGERALFIKKSF